MIEFKDNTAYHAETEKEAEWLLNKAHEQRYKWCDFTSFIQDNNWSKYTYQTCYSIKEWSFCDKGYYENKNYTIIKVKDLMQKNMNEITQTENGFIFKPKYGQEIDLEKSDLSKGVVVFKEVKQKYPMELVPESMVLSIADKLNLFGRLVLTCREWNRIDGFGNDDEDRYAIRIRSIKGELKVTFGNFVNNTPTAFKYQPTAELFQSTFNKELQEVKEFL